MPTQLRLSTVNLNPKVGVVKTTPTDRALARLCTADMIEPPKSDAEHDLAGDAFMSLFKFDPHTKDEVQPDRLVNKAVIDWAIDAWKESHYITAGSLASSIATTQIALPALLSDSTVQEALNKQKEAEDKMKQAEEALEASVAHSAQENNESNEMAQELAKQAQELIEEAHKLGNDALTMLKEFQESNVGKGVAAYSATKAKEEAQNVAGFMKGWGLEKGNETEIDARQILNLMENMPPTMKQISDILGKLKGVAKQAIDSSRSKSNIVTEVDTTQDPKHIFQTEWAYLSKKAPLILRYQKTAELVDHGLLGWVSKPTAHEAGSFVAYVDGSGSMEGQCEIYAKALAMAIGQAVYESGEDRQYEISMFGADYDGFTRVSNQNTWIDHIHWASRLFGGGTDFNYAFHDAIERIKLLAPDAESGLDVDLLFITDGGSVLYENVINEWNKFREEHKSRLLTIIIGTERNDALHDISDMYVAIEDVSPKSINELADKFATFMYAED